MPSLRLTLWPTAGVGLACVAISEAWSTGARRWAGSAGRRKAGSRLSAMAGVTDALLGMAGGVAEGDGTNTSQAVEALRKRHADAARALVPAGERRRELLSLIDDSFRELDELTRGILALRELTPRTSD